MLGNDRLIPLRRNANDIFEGLNNRLVGNFAQRIHHNGVLRPACRLDNDALPCGKRQSARSEIIGFATLLEFDNDNLCHSNLPVM